MEIWQYRLLPYLAISQILQMHGTFMVSHVSHINVILGFKWQKAECQGPWPLSTYLLTLKCINIISHPL